MISARTKIALAQVKKRGIRLGNPRWKETLHLARAVRNPLSSSPQVVQIVEQQRQEGRTLRAIAEHLHGLGIMTSVGERRGGSRPRIPQGAPETAVVLQEQGRSTVLVPDLRGHGANRPHGDVAYVGPLDDDMEDFVQAVKPVYRGKRWTLLGFSSGAGFALRISGDPQGKEFDRYILLSPFLRYEAPTARQDAARPKDDAHWYSVSVKRIVGLSILGSFGIHHFDGLPVISFPVPDNLESVTASYSLRMQENFEPHKNYRADIWNSHRPMLVFVGGADELFYPEQFSNVFHSEWPDVPVTIIAGMTHSDMITKPLAIQTAVQAVQQFD
jgi:pimeloyl-ACP methyl ester carboxylesterase